MVAVLTSDMSISYSETRLRLPTGILQLTNLLHLLMRSNCNTKTSLKELVHFQVNHTILIRIQLFHQNGYHVDQFLSTSKTEFKKQLNEMLDAGIIAEVHEATPWINSFVIVETMKDGQRKLCICLDPKPLNKAIMCEPYMTCTPNDVYHKLANAKYITVIDFKKSFWQFVLDEESSYCHNFQHLHLDVIITLGCPLGPMYLEIVTNVV